MTTLSITISQELNLDTERKEAEKALLLDYLFPESEYLFPLDEETKEILKHAKKVHVTVKEAERIRKQLKKKKT